MKKIKGYILLFILVALQGAAIALALKAAIGVAPWDALNQSVSDLSGIKVGTVIIILNGLLVVGQLFMVKKEFGLRHLLQMAVSLLMGSIINFTLYNIYTFEITSYLQSAILFLIAIFFMALIAGAVMALDIITFPVEAFCKELSKKIKPTFVQIRQGLDVFSIIFSLAISLLFKEPFAVREGTILAMLFFAPVMGWAMNLTEEPLRKLGFKHD
ncbi:MAG: hypothetical protein GXY87_00695 [Tissierellia bacterium]|nr:hypothetical protein [Tissierellia bacterium]